MMPDHFLTLGLAAKEQSRFSKLHRFLTCGETYFALRLLVESIIFPSFF